MDPPVEITVDWDSWVGDTSYANMCFVTNCYYSECIGIGERN